MRARFDTFKTKRAVKLQAIHICRTKHETHILQMWKSGVAMSRVAMSCVAHTVPAFYKTQRRSRSKDQSELNSIAKSHIWKSRVAGIN